MIDRLYVKFQTELGAGNPAMARLLNHYGSIEAVFAATPSQVRSVARSSAAERLFNNDYGRTDEILNMCAENNIKIIHYEHPEYPKRLKNISDFPALLYCKGDLPFMDDQVAVAVVGPRKPDDYGIKAAFSLAARLARGGAVVVSGGAMGVDTEAHAGALWAGGKTVAVLGCGILFPYLMSNAKLREDIANQGALVSEFAPDAGAYKAHFPIRNRIMSGLSLGTVVVQAAAKSGALITARHAAEQGRDVFVVPGRSGEKLFEGSNLLLKDGAKPVLNVVDILEEYVERYPHRLLLDKVYSAELPSITEGFRRFHSAADEKLQTTKETKVKSAPKEISCGLEAQTVYNVLIQGAAGTDEIEEITGLSISRVIVALTELEIGGYIAAAPGGLYKISD